MSRVLAALTAGAATLAATGAATAWADPGSASPVAVSFTAAAAAPVLQVTEDEPSSTFHPEGEGEYGYTVVTANPSAASALAALAWPGSAAGNAGTLIAVLGGPGSLSALNDPVQASAATGTAQTQSSVGTPAGTTMSASVVPAGPTDQHATATSTLAGGGLGAAGTVGNSASTSTIDFDSGTGLLTATSQSRASDLSVAGVVHVGSVTSSASAVASDGAAPVLTGSTTFHDMTIAGEEAYVDGSGVHLGSPGSPAGPAAVDSVDTALAAAGMEVYFTSPHAITVGGVAYYYAASLLFYWAPPGDSSRNSFTMSVGGSAVSVTDSAEPYAGFALGGTDGAGAGLGGPAGGATGSAGPAASSPASGAALAGAATALPAGNGAGATGTGAALAGLTGPSAGPSLSLPASPSAAASTAVGGPVAAVTADARLPGGIGAGWWVLVAVAALAGAALTTRVPVLLRRQAAAGCPRARHPASSPGHRKDSP